MDVLDEYLDEISTREGLQAEGIPSLQEGYTARQVWNLFIWHGGSALDAWLNTSAAQVGQVILSMPYSYAQMGFKLGVVFHVLYITLGGWASYLIACLYLEYRARREKEGIDFKKHVIQYHEVMGYLIGPWLKRTILFGNILTFGGIGAIQIIALASNAYYLNSSNDKRNWTFIFGAICTLVVLLPSFHNFRIWSVLGVLTTAYTAWYMVIASVIHGQEPGLKRSAPQTMKEFFTGTSNILYAFGGR